LADNLRVRTIAMDREGGGWASSRSLSLPSSIEHFQKNKTKQNKTNWTNVRAAAPTGGADFM
jgi:hypothetical protein